MPTHPSPPRNGDITRLLEELRSAVATLPIESKFTPIKLAYGGVTAPVHVLKQRVDDIIQQLRFLAHYGSDEAMEALRDIGNHAAELLRTFLPANVLEERLTQLPKHYPPSTVPPVLLDMDMGGVSEILTREREMIDSSSREQILSCYRSIAGRPDIRVKVSIPPLIPSSGAGNEIAGTGSVTANGSLGAQHAIQEVVRSMVDSRLSEILAPRMHNALFTVAGCSLVWPVPASAFKDLRPDIAHLLDALPLGRILPFRLDPIKGPGRKREPYAGPVALALDYCTQLSLVQYEMKSLSPRSRGILAKKDELLESSKCANVCPFEIKDQDRTLRFEQHWQVKAALLPDYPATSKDKSPARRREQAKLEKWLKAAELLAKFECGGDWESHRWPPGIKPQAGRGMDDVIKDKLKIGMKRLQPVE